MATIPPSNIKISALRSVFVGPSNIDPLKLSDLYADAASGYAAGVSGLPNRGTPISMSTFAGKSKNSAPSSVLGGAVLALEARAPWLAQAAVRWPAGASSPRPTAPGGRSLWGPGGSRGGKYASFTATSQQFMYLSNKQLNLLSGNGGTIACVVRFKTPVNQWERIFSAMTVADNKKDVISVYRYSNQTVMDYSFPTWVGVNNAIVNDAWAVYIMR
ncbi:hypothetical protein HYH03_010902 [Edaphochlamys debaryana]|uniref:Uncharacterized protein n=1 Tax=Edaphochlamys debaryana TaxID=47281 RepID=A0A835XW88_9CHLO|nr:hypothetical protein HYH03_010902 [Edaphochlamys debaryana]|eukprot:KAG2490747.1 hypothetical protein HYH03_010902 [Edaphochlamys debaryana]